MNMDAKNCSVVLYTAISITEANYRFQLFLIATFCVKAQNRTTFVTTETSKVYKTSEIHFVIPTQRLNQKHENQLWDKP